jgi:hypothetical protein
MSELTQDEVYEITFAAQMRLIELEQRSIIRQIRQHFDPSCTTWQDAERVLMELAVMEGGG